MAVMEAITDSDRLQRLRELEAHLRDPRGVINVDSLLVRKANIAPLSYIMIFQ